MFKNALVSTSNKEGLVEFLRPFVEKGMRIVSTGGTSKHLREHGLAVIEVAEQTGFPEVMDGRVRTLHPRIHMPLLARAGVAEDMELLNANGLEPFDLVVVNLYPFEKAAEATMPIDELVEFIDIGGPSLLRAAAKNHERIAVVCEPGDYAWITSRNELSLADRRRLAARVFAHTSRYDSVIARSLEPENLDHRFLAGQRVQDLRYGENPGQKAAWYRSESHGLHEAHVRHGKPLSYNNILDLEAACSMLREFTQPCAVAVKHNNPCGVGIDSRDLRAAAAKALTADPVSVFGGIVALNRIVEKDDAEELSRIFLECVIAPGFSPEAFERLSKKKDIRLLEWPALDASGAMSNETVVAGGRGGPDSPKGANGHRGPDGYAGSNALDRVEFRSVTGGYLAQTVDRVWSWPDEPSASVGPSVSRGVGAGAVDAAPASEARRAWTCVGERPSDRVRADLDLAWKVCAHLKSNAIALAAGGRTVGLGMGQVNRVDAVEQAIVRMRKHHGDLGGDAVLASDAFFPFPDSIDLIAEAGIRWVVQPGGSVRDEAVFARAKERKINLILTHTRHFRH